jgi:capsular exopolysaccharide synthesis family protein
VKEPLYEEDEIDLRELFKVIHARKIVIMFVAFITLVIASFYTYLKPLSYESYCIGEIKMKSSSTPAMPNDLFGAMGGLSNDDLDKKMALYSTFMINKKVLDEVSLEVQYFLKKDIKLHEVYDGVAITISDINITDKSYLGKEFKIFPYEGDYFTLEISDKGFLKNKFFEKRYKYGEFIQTENFQFLVEKNSDFLDPYIVKFNGNKRDIYENIIKDNLKFTRVDPKGSMIKISYTDTISKRAKKYLDVLTKIISFESVIEKNEENEKVINSIENQLSDVKAKLDLSEDKMEKYKVKEDYVSPTQQTNTLVSKISNTDSDLTKAKLKYSTISDIQNKILQSEKFTDVSLSLAELGDDKTSTLLSSLKEAQKNYRQMSTRFTQEYPDLAKIGAEINQMKQEIKVNIDRLSNTIFNKIENLKSVKAQLEQKLKSLPKKERTMVNFNRENQINSKMYNYLLQQKSERVVKRSSMESDFKLVDQVYTDIGSVKPKKELIIVVAGITGLILGIFLAFVMEFLDDRVRDIKKVEESTKIPIFGVVPKIFKNKRGLEVLKKPNSKIAENFRVIKRYIRSKNHAASNTILVTSSLTGEGKTLTAVNLASIFSVSGHKSVIINIDLKRPKLHELFSIDPSIGVSNYLQGECKLSDIIQKTKHKNLDAIVAGPIHDDYSDLLLSGELNGLLTYLRESYEYVIIDAAPIKTGHDTIDLMEYVDMSLFVVRVGTTTTKQIEGLNDIVKENDLENVAIVVNDVHAEDIHFKYRVKRDRRKTDKKPQDLQSKKEEVLEED